MRYASLRHGNEKRFRYLADCCLSGEHRSRCTAQVAGATSLGCIFSQNMDSGSLGSGSPGILGVHVASLWTAPAANPASAQRHSPQLCPSSTNAEAVSTVSSHVKPGVERITTLSTPFASQQPSFYSTLPPAPGSGGHLNVAHKIDRLMLPRFKKSGSHVPSKSTFHSPDNQSVLLASIRFPGIRSSSAPLPASLHCVPDRLVDLLIFFLCIRPELPPEICFTEFESASGMSSCKSSGFATVTLVYDFGFAVVQNSGHAQHSVVTSPLHSKEPARPTCE